MPIRSDFVVEFIVPSLSANDKDTQESLWVRIAGISTERPDIDVHLEYAVIETCLL